MKGNRFTHLPTKVDRRLRMYINLGKDRWFTTEPTDNAFYGVSLAPMPGSRTACFNSLLESTGWTKHVLPALRRLARKPYVVNGPAKVLIFLRVPIPKHRKGTKDMTEKTRWATVRAFMRWVKKHYPELAEWNDSIWIYHLAIVN